MASSNREKTRKSKLLKAGDKFDLEERFVHLARLALQGRQADIAAIARQTLMRIEAKRSDLAEPIAAVFGLADTSPLRRQLNLPVPVDSESRIELLRTEWNVRLEREPQWPAPVLEVLDGVVRERQREEALRAADIAPAKSLLFVGPPGVGKTLAARWLARATGRPLFILDLASVMNSLLGKTGTNLRAIMDFAKRQRCVLLLDEFDALAKRRDDETEVGELKRLVTVLIQELDAWPDESLLICATNHPELLDPAIWRRFEVTLNFPKPSPEQISALIEARLGASKGQSAKLAGEILADTSFADIDRLIDGARRKAVVDSVSIDTALLFGLSRHAAAAPADQRLAIGQRLMEAGVSQRQASELTGVARDTLRKHASKEAGARRGKKPGAA